MPKKVWNFIHRWCGFLNRRRAFGSRWMGDWCLYWEALKNVFPQPPGLTFMSISRDAWNAILKRKTPIIGYYCNLAVWKSWYEDRVVSIHTTGQWYLRV